MTYMEREAHVSLKQSATYTQGIVEGRVDEISNTTKLVWIKQNIFELEFIQKISWTVIYQKAFDELSVLFAF